MSFTKHVGLDNAKKIIIMSHSLPGPDGHMCLVVYPEKMPQQYLEHLSRVLNSAEGQAAKNLMDEAFKVTMPDGRNLLVTLHSEGHLKKRPTNQVFIQPDSRNKLYLSELNNMLEKIEEGGTAKTKLEEYDAGRGLNKKDAVQNVTVNPVPESAGAVISSPVTQSVPVLTNESIASDLHANSQKLMDTATLLIAEAKSLEAQAKLLVPVKKREAKNTVKKDSI